MRAAPAVTCCLFLAVSCCRVGLLLGGRRGFFMPGVLRVWRSRVQPVSGVFVSGVAPGEEELGDLCCLWASAMGLGCLCVAGWCESGSYPQISNRPWSLWCRFCHPSAMVWAKARATVRGAESSGDRGCALVGRVLARSAGVRGAMAAGLALVMVSGVAGCARDDAVAGGSPSSSGGSATASGSGVSTPAPSEDPLFTEAKAVHLKYVEEMVTFEMRGGGSQIPQSMSALIEGEYEAAVTKAYAEFASQGLYAEPGSTWTRTAVWRVDIRDGHAVGLGACVDLRGVIYSRDGTDKTSRGPWRRDELMFNVRGDSVVISEGSSRKVDSCAP